MRTVATMMCAAMLGAVLAGCGDRDDHGNYVPKEGREETKTLQGTDTLGYGYTRKKVDKVLDTNDNRIEQLNQEMEKQE